MSARQITISKTVTIEPFAVPNYVTVTEMGVANLKLRDVPYTTLTAMCDEWVNAVLKAAERIDPAKENDSDR